MKKILAFVIAIVAVVSLFAGCGDKEPEKLGDVKFDSFAIGYGKADITPDPTTQIMITGNNDHATRLSTSVLEPLWVNCVAFTDTDGTTVLQFGMDLHGTPENVVDAVRAAIEEQTGIPGIQVQFNASHSHGAPHTDTSAVPAVKKSDENIIAKCIESAITALETRKPAQMSVTFFRTENMNFMRHYIMTDGTYVGKNGGDISDELLLGYMEQVDNQMQLIKFTREGEKDVIMINWQGHPMSAPSEYYTALTSQNIGVMRRVLLEKADVESVYILGASGDCTNHSAIAKDVRYGSYDAHGEALADMIIEAMDTFQPAETGKIHFVTREITLDTRTYELDAYGFGDIGFVSEPWETFNTNGMAVKENSPYYMTFYASIANGNPSTGYMPDEKSFTYDCYEHGPMFTPAGSAEIVEETLLEMLNECFTASGQTQKEKAEDYIMDHSPKPNGVTYKITSQSVAIPGQNGHYQVKLDNAGSMNTLLVETKELADDILSRSTVKLLFNEQNMVTAIDNS